MVVGVGFTGSVSFLFRKNVIRAAVTLWRHALSLICKMRPSFTRTFCTPSLYAYCMRTATKRPLRQRKLNDSAVNSTIALASGANGVRDSASISAWYDMGDGACQHITPLHPRINQQSCHCQIERKPLNEEHRKGRPNLKEERRLKTTSKEQTIEWMKAGSVRPPGGTNSSPYAQLMTLEKPINVDFQSAREIHDLSHLRRTPASCGEDEGRTSVTTGS